MHQEFTPKDIARFWSKIDRSGGPDACWPWTGATDKDGYGKFALHHRLSIRAHRFSWELTNGPIPKGMDVCHTCDNPGCLRPDHLWLGTSTENIADRHAKGRTARGDTSGPRMHPERMARGERHGTHTKPESVPRGDAHSARLHPERMARGDAHGMRLHPDRVPRADKNGMARLTWEAVRDMRARYATGGVSQQSLADEYGVHQTVVSLVVRNKTWRE